MNIIEKADKYADGKANEAITKAIAQAYLDGYRDGYNDREAEIPVDFRDNKTKYIDLGLPSGTLWSEDYEKDDGDLLFLPYDRAEYMKIPTAEQWQELVDECRWEIETDGVYDYLQAKCIGPNGNIIRFKRTGKKDADTVSCEWEAFFWVEETQGEELRNIVHLYNSAKKFKRNNLAKYLDYQFTGYHLPIRLVR